MVILLIKSRNDNISMLQIFRKHFIISAKKCALVSLVADFSIVASSLNATVQVFYWGMCSASAEKPVSFV